MYFHSMEYDKTQAVKEHDLGLQHLSDGYLTMAQRQIGLTFSQATVLDEIETRHQENLAKLQLQLEAALKPQRKLGLDMMAQDGKVTPTAQYLALGQPAKDVVKQMDDLTDNSVKEVHAQLGEDGFTKVDGFLHRFIKTTQQTIPAPSPAAAPKTAEKAAVAQ